MMRRLVLIALVLTLGMAGQIWAQSNNLWDVQFADATTVYAVGDAGRILKSVNGGQSWGQQSSGTTKPLLGGSFTSSGVGSIAGGDVLNGGNANVRTTNGSSWSSQAVPTTRVLTDASFVDANTGYISGFWGTILKTTNSGGSWQELTTGSATNFHGVSFVNASFGVGVGDYGLVMRTTDGGASWASRSGTTTSNLRDVEMINTSVGVAVGFGGKILRTVDGGNTWSLVGSGTTVNLQSVTFADANTGYVAGAAGKVLKTTDGGASWTDKSAAFANWYGVAFSSASTGIVVGDGGGVVARTVDGGSSWTRITDFSGGGGGGSAPVAPALFSPASGSTGLATTLVLSWYASGGATSYRLQVSTSSTFSTLAYDNASLTTTSAQVSGLLNNTPYYWRVSASNAYGTSPYSSMWNFTTVVAPPATPALASPASGSTGISTSPTLVWNASSGATAYHLQVSTSSTFSTLVYDNASLTTTSAALSGLAYSTPYYWRVSASNLAGSSSYSGAWVFTTQAAPVSIPPVPVLASPASGSTGRPTTLTLSWNASTGATAYRLQVSASSAFSTLVYDNASLTSTSASVSGLAYLTTYYWRVSASNTAGSSAFSGAWNFVTTTAPVTVPPVPVLASPANGAVGQPTSLTLGWNASSTATTYRLQVSTVATFSSTVVDDATLTTTSRVVSSLANNTLYYWRVSATNSAGSSAFSAAWAFTTVALPPSATTSAATSVTTSSATLNGSVNPNATATTAWFEWGTSSTLSTYTSTTALSAGNGVTAVAQSSTLTGLTAGATYYFRMAAQNSGGTTRGAIMGFTTTSAGVPSFAVSPTSINFGTIKIGKSKQDSVVVTNAGSATLTISSITSNSAQFVVSPVSGSVPAGGSMKVYITFTAPGKSTYTGTISFAHNAAGSPGTVSVSGRGGSGATKFSRTTSSSASLPTAYAVGQNYPNPFNPTTTIAFSLVDPSQVRLTVYNSIGQEVALLADGQFDAGEQAVQWDASAGSGNVLPSGVYFYRIHATSLVNGEEFQSVRRMILMK